MTAEHDDALTPQIATPVAKRERPSPWIILGIVGMLVLVVLSSTTGERWMNRLRYEGVAAPEVHLPQATTPVSEDGVVSLSQFQGKVMLLDFWATWCGPCRKQLPVVEGLSRDATLADSLKIVTINIDEHAPDRVANVEAYLKMKGYRATTLLDDGSAQRAYRISSIPTMVVVDRHGEVFQMLYGVHDETMLRGVIAEASRL